MFAGSQIWVFDFSFDRLFAFRCGRLLLMIALQTWRRNDSENWPLNSESTTTTTTSSLQFIQAFMIPIVEMLEEMKHSHHPLYFNLSCHSNPTCMFFFLECANFIQSIYDEFVRGIKKKKKNSSFLSSKYYLCISSKNIAKKKKYPTTRHGIVVMVVSFHFWSLVAFATV